MNKYKLDNRYDLLTGELLECKSPKDYNLLNFKDKRNMKKYFVKAKEEDKLNELSKLIKGIFEQYNQIKEITHAPSHAELKSIKYLPNIITLNEYYIGGYDKLISDLNLKKRFNYSDFISKEMLFSFDLPDSLKIICDSREQSGFKFGKGIDFEVRGLPFGDYTLDRENQIVSIERKSQSDFIGTLGNGFDRFCREVERTAAKEKYLIVLVEQKFSNIASFEYQPGYFGKATSEFIFHRMRDVCRKFPCNVQFLFADGKREAARLVPYLLLLNENILDKDLEFIYNS